MTQLIIPLESELVFAKRCEVVRRRDYDQYLTFSQPYSIQLIMEETSGFTYTYHFKDDIASWVNNNIKPVTFDVIPLNQLVAIFDNDSDAMNQLVAIFDNDSDAILFKMMWL